MPYNKYRLHSTDDLADSGFIIFSNNNLFGSKELYQRRLINSIDWANNKELTILFFCQKTACKNNSLANQLSKLLFLL